MMLKRKMAVEGQRPAVFLETFWIITCFYNLFLGDSRKCTKLGF